MSVPPVTVNGVKPYSLDPIVVAPVAAGFSATLGAAVATSSAPTTSAASAPLGRSAASAGLSIDPTGALTTSTGRNVLTLGQMLGDGVASGAASPLGAATITRPGLSNYSALSRSGATSGTKGAVAPQELLQYGNGRIPAEALTLIGIGSHRLYAPAAQGFIAMRAAAAAEGVDIGVTDSYRSYEEQVDLVRRKGLYSQGGYAAVPGTSKHGWGMALDVDVDPAGLAWMRENAGRFGFVECVPREPWHWEFTGANPPA